MSKHHKDEHGSAAGCAACAHDHGASHAHGKAERWSIVSLVAGAVLFAAGWLLPESISRIVWIAAYLLIGAEVLLHAIRNIAGGHLFDEQVLMAIATIGALCLGEIGEAAAVMLFYRIGEWLQDKAVESSRKRISDAVELHPDRACVLRDGGQVTVEPEAVAVGERIFVRVGERIPLDGIVESGESRIDVSMLTGEPAPVPVRADSPVQAGSVNTSSALTIRVTVPASESSTSRLLHAVEDAAENKPQLERFITRFSHIYTPCVVGLAALVAVLPPLLLEGQSFTEWLHRALIFLVISCPCALVLSIPLSFFAGLAVSSKHSVLFKGADALESTAAVRAVVMDKTGTLTKGEYAVQQIDAVNATEERILSIAAALEKDSLHPIAFAILQAAGEEPVSAQNVSERAGRGMEGTVDGKRALLGNARLLDEAGIAVPPGAEGVFVAFDGQYLGAIRVGDELRESAADAVAALNRCAGFTAILTGDRKENAEATAAAVGATEVHSALLPEQKLSMLREIRQRVGKTMFIGDGINDAPVLAGADVGVAMGLGGTEMAAEAADALLLSEDLTRLPAAIRTARRTVRTARINIAIALSIKAAATVFAALGLAGMWIAVVADAGAALVCVLHTLLLFRKSE